MPATTIDTHAVTELILFADNTEYLYAAKKPYIANVKRRIKRGDYSPTKAIKLWRYWVDYAATRYCAELGCDASTFPPVVRQAAAKAVSEREYDAIICGDYDEKGA